MKAAVDDLFQLIRALSPSEKRYVSIRNAGDSDALYVYLYGLIDAQSSYDEEAVAQAVRGRDKSANLSMLKKYLESYLIGVLCDYHGASKDAWHTHRVLFVSKILHDKGLNRMSLRMLDGIREGSLKSGAYQAAMLSTRMLLSHSEDYYPQDELAQIQSDLYDSSQAILKALAREQDYVYLQVTTQRLMREMRTSNTDDVRAELCTLLQHECLQPGAATTPRQAITASSTQSRIHMLLGEVQEAFQYSLQNVRDWEQLAEYNTTYLISYAGALNNAFIRALFARQYSAVLDMRVKIAALPHTTHEMKLFKYQSLTQIDLIIVYLTGKYHELDAIVQSFTKASPDYQRYTPPYMLRSIYTSIASLYFLQGDWQGALKHLAATTADDTIDVTAEQGRVLSVLAHCMMRNESVIESICRSHKRNAKEQARATPMEIDAAALARKLLRLDTQQEKALDEIASFETAHRALLTQQATEGKLFGTAIRLWIEHIRSGKPMIELAKEATPMAARTA
jgi:hypothetical protein